MPVEVTLPSGSPEVHEDGTTFVVEPGGHLRIDYGTPPNRHPLAVYTPGQWLKAKVLKVK